MRNARHLIVILVLGFLSNAYCAFVGNVKVVKACPYNVVISWIGSAENGFNIYRSASLLSSGKYIGSVSYNVSTYTDPTVQGGRTYYYTVEAVDQTTSDTSIHRMVQVQSTLNRPVSPTIKLLEKGIEVSWMYFDNDYGINVFRSTDNGSYVLVASLQHQYSTSWVDYDVYPGKAYSYKISSFNECGESDASYSSNTVVVPSLPELVTDSLNVIVRGDTLYGRFIVANRGDATAIEKFDVGVLLNNTDMQSWETDGYLKAGWYLTYNFKWKIPSAISYISACADFTNKVKQYSGKYKCLSDTVYASQVGIGTHNMRASELNQHLRIVQKALFVDVNEKYVLSVFDVRGNRMYQYSGVVPTGISLDFLPSGGYFVTLQSIKGKISRAFFKD